MIENSVGEPQNLPTQADACPHLKAGDRHYQNHFNPQEAESQLTLALNEYARALEQWPDSADIMAKMALAFLRQGQPAKAEQSAKRVFSLHESGTPVSSNALAKAYLVRGLIAYNQDDPDAAERYLRQNLAKAPWQAPVARYCLFKLYRNDCLKNWRKPASIWKAVLALYFLTSSLILLAFGEERINPQHLLLLIPQLTLAWFQEECGRSEAALARYMDIHQQFPGLPSVSIIIGELYREMGHSEEARHWFEKTVDRHPDNLNGHYHLARLLEDQESYPQMAEVYETVLQITPNQADIHCHLGNANYYMSNYTKAISHYGTALQLGQDSRWKAMVAQSLANIQADFMQNPQAAIAYYDMARLLDPTDVENYIQMGLLYFQQEDYLNAEAVYLKALPISPKLPKLYSNLGYLRWMANDVEQAITYYEKAIALDGDYEIPINNLGVIYLDMLGQVEKAIGYFEQAISLDVNYALAYYNMGRAYSFLGNRLEAAHCFKTAQALNVESKDLDNDELSARIYSLFDSCEIELRD